MLDRSAVAAGVSPAPRRFERLDALRGVAMLWMAAYHFAFDLNFLGWLSTRQDFYRDPVWTTQRTCIVSLFLFCAGMSIALALDAGQPWRKFWRRWPQVAGCALLVSIGSAFMFPKSWIFFGVLHGMAAMLIIARLAAPLKRALWPLAALCIAAPIWLNLPLFDMRALQWIGLGTHKPVTEDYVPVLPWLGVMLIGLAAGQWMLSKRSSWLSGTVPRRARALVLLGRWPLTFYMLHQPVFIGLLMALKLLG
jgi:uncharacterized membrane protein